MALRQGLSQTRGTETILVVGDAQRSAPSPAGCWWAAGTPCSRRPAIAVLYMSGYTDDAIVNHGVLEGVPYLEKPFTRDDLARKMRKVPDRGPTPRGA